MEPNQIVKPVEQPTSPIRTQLMTPLTQSFIPQPKPSKLPIILLTLTSLFSIFGLVYFYFQTQALQQQLTSQPNPTSSVIAIAQPSPTVNPTGDWQTYSNTNIGATIKYPPTWTIKEDSNGKSVDFNTNIKSPKIVGEAQVNYFFNFQLEDSSNFQAWSNDPSSTKLDSVTINNKVFERYIGADMFYTLNYIHKKPDNMLIRFYLGPYTKEEAATSLDQTVKQILSTLTFLK